MRRRGRWGDEEEVDEERDEGWWGDWRVCLEPVMNLTATNHTTTRRRRRRAIGGEMDVEGSTRYHAFVKMRRAKLWWILNKRYKTAKSFWEYSLCFVQNHICAIVKVIFTWYLMARLGFGNKYFLENLFNIVPNFTEIPAKTLKMEQKPAHLQGGR